MAVLYFILVLLALICFAVAVPKRVTRVDLVALGLAFWVAVEFIQRLKGLE